MPVNGGLFDADDGLGGDGEADAPVLRVVPCAPAPKAYDYLGAPGVAAPPGAYVVAPFGGRDVLGVVWGPGGAGEDALPRARLKPISRVLDLPPMTAAMRRFLERAADYTLTPLGEMARIATRAPQLADPAPTRRVLRRGPAPLDAAAGLTPSRARAWEAFLALAEAHAGPAQPPPGAQKPFEIAPAALAREAGVGAGVVQALAAAGLLEEIDAPRDAAYRRLDPTRPRSPLSDEQAAAAEQLAAAARAGAFRPVLLHGVTGSGKTEAYLEAVAACVAAGRQAVVLIPEIALTEQFLGRVEKRFGARPAEWHSAVGAADRRRCWRAVAAGQAQLVVGARSALFLPFPDLGLIVVDEEHDGAYKQEDGAIYHARDMAVLRAAEAKAAIILASATPSLETYVNAAAGRYETVRLENRFGPAVEPDVRAIDIRRDRPERGKWIAPSLVDAVRETIARGEQALLFLNRRGYAPLTLCRSCGARRGCPHCDAWLVSHRFTGKLVCHLCGHEETDAPECRSCGSDDMAACGPGVERLAEEAAETFPDARLALLSSDLAPSPADLKRRIAAIAEGEADIVIGTQIVAKGHNFPNLTLVGVVDADLGLYGGDFRAAERTFQLLRQVAGRAGRAEKPGRALLQTAAPEQPIMRLLAAGDEPGFLQLEAAERERVGAPPFGRYVGVIFSGPEEPKVWEVARAFAQEADLVRAAGAEVLGPAPAPIPRIRGKARVRMLIKAPRRAALQPALRAWDARVKRRGSVRVVFDVDPQSFL